MKIYSNTRVAWIILCVVLGGGTAFGQTTLTGSSLALKSLNSATLTGSSYDSSYVGTYLTVPTGGATLNFDVNATESAFSSSPHLNVSIADSNFGFNVSSTSATNYDTPNVTLPAGTYFISAQRDYGNNSASTGGFTVNNLSVNTVSGSAVTFSNTSTDANALAAANTYITNYRQGPATVHLSGPNGVPMLAGTPVNAKLGNIAFNFGDAVPGFSDSNVSSYLGGSSGSYTSLQSNFQSQLNLNFNAMVLGNDGKWSSNSTSQNNVDMTGVNTFLNYAQSHQMLARMHNLIWGPQSGGSQQPSWVTSLVSADNTSAVNSAITSRIGYYVGTGTSSDPSLKFQQIDVYNESYHTGQGGGTDTYWSVLGGASGIANVYNQVATAIAKSGSKAVTFTNEYNVFQNSNDNYANWYVSNVDAIRDAGGNVGEIGIEYYPTQSIGSSDSSHSAARIESVLQGVAAQGLPTQVDEFGVAGTAGQSNATVDQILSDTMTMMFGDPTATGFVMWGDENASINDYYQGAAIFYNVSGNTWTLTPAGQTYQALLGINANSGGWNTNVNLTADANGNINFNGYYGQYYLAGEPLGSLNQKFIPFDLNMQKGTSSYNTTLAKPPNWFFWDINASSGSWTTGGNWTDSTQGGGTPSTAGYTAYFGSSATSYSLSTGAATTVNITTPAIEVMLASPVTLGMLVFDNATTSYSITGVSTISLQGYNNSSGHAAAIYDNNGSHGIFTPLLMLDNTTVTVVPTNATLTLLKLQTSTATLTKAGAGILAVNAVNAAGLTVSGGTLRIISNGTSTGASVVNSLSVASGATLDLANNSIAVNYTGASPAAALSADIAAAYDEGKWDLPGITSSTAANSLDYAVGNYDTGTEVFIAYTLVGDANMDGWVNGSDLAMMQSGGTTWSQGDFNYDGVVNADDYALFMLGADESAVLGRPVPEPAEMVPVICLAAISMRRFRVRCSGGEKGAQVSALM